MACYSYYKKLDDALYKIAKYNGNLLASVPPQGIHLIRQLYDDWVEKENLGKAENEKLPLLIELVRQNNESVAGSGERIAAAALHEFLVKENNKVKWFVKQAKNNISQNVKRLSQEYDSSTRHNRAHNIAYKINGIISQLMAENPRKSLEEIVHGFTDGSGKVVGGVANILRAAYMQFIDIASWHKDAANYISEFENNESKKETEIAEHLHLADENMKIVQNWAPLLVYAKHYLREKTGLDISDNNVIRDPKNQDLIINPEMDDYDRAEATKESYQEKPEVKSALKSIGQVTKTLLYNLYEGRGQNLDDMGVPKAINPVKAHRDLKVLTTGAIDENSFVRLLEYRLNNPMDEFEKQEYEYLRDILQVIKTNNLARTQLYTDLTKDWTPYSILVSEKKDGNISNRKSNLNASDQLYYRILDNLGRTRQFPYRQSEMSLHLMSESGVVAFTEMNYQYSNTVQFTSDQDSVAKRFYKYYTYQHPDETTYITKISDDFKALSLNDQVDVLHDILVPLGISLSTQVIEDIISQSPKTLERLFRRIHNIFWQFTHLQKGNQLQNNRLVDILREGNSDAAVELRENYKRLAKLISKAAKYSITNEEASILYKRQDGTYVRYFSHTAPSFLGQFINHIQYYIKENAKEELKNFLDEKYLNCQIFKYNGQIFNSWLEELYKACDKDEALYESVGDLFELTRELGGMQTDFKNFSQAQFSVDMWTSFFYPEETKKFNENDNMYAEYSIFVTGDSGAQKYITARRYKFDDVVKNLIKIAKSEEQRVLLINAFDNWCDSPEDGLPTEYEKLKGDNLRDNTTYTLLDFLNKDYKYPGQKKGKYYDIMTNETDKDEGLRKAIEQYLEDCSSNYKDNMIKSGVISVQENGEIKTEKINQLQEGENIDTKIKDFVSNHTLATINQIQLMTIDSGFYKDVTDLQKRYKEIHSSGNILSIFAKDFNGKYYARIGENGEVNPYQKTLYFKDGKGNAEIYNPEFMKVIADAFGVNSWQYEKYKKNPIADGQSLRTLESYRSVMGMLGRWTESYERIYNRITDIRNAAKSRESKQFTKQEFIELNGLLGQFQPIKPFMFTHEHVRMKDKLGIEREMIVPVQYKCSESIVIPELLSTDSPLRDLVEYMEDKHIDVACESSVIKVGEYGAFNIYDTANKEELIHNLETTAKVHDLDYRDYRIVSNVPEHLYNERQVGVQLRKIFYNNLIHYSLENGTIKFDNREIDYLGNREINLGAKIGKVKLNAGNLLILYNQLVSADMVQNYQEFTKFLDNPEKLTNMFMENILRGDRGIEATIDGFSLDAEGKFLSPIFDGVTSTDNIAFLLSAFRKKVNQQITSGGSLVQASAFGINNYEKKEGLKYLTKKINGKENILAAECEVPAEILVYKDEAGYEHNIDITNYINSDGTFIESESGKLDEYGEKLTKIEEDYPDCLSLIAYRVPTEREYSMINLRIKRVTPRVFGGTIKVPIPHTTIAGFDFDIDKLYFMKKTFRKGKIVTELTDKQRLDIWNQVWKDNNFLFQILQAARENDPEGKVDDKGKLKKLHSYIDRYPEIDKQALFESAAEKLGFIKGKNYDVLEVDLAEYDYNKTPFENNKDSRDNLFFELIKKRLMDPDTLENRVTPGGYAEMSEDTAKIKQLLYGDQGIGDNELFNSSGEIDHEVLNKRIKEGEVAEPTYSFSDPMTMLIYTEQNQVAEKVIGIMANHSSNAYYTSIMHTFELKNKFGFAGHSFMDIAHPVVDNMGNVLRDGTKLVAQMLAAAVDAVKDPVLPYLNINITTANAAALLARLGYNTYEIGLFLNQPIIKEVCEVVSNDKVHTSSAIYTVFNKYNTDKDINLNILDDNLDSFNPSVELMESNLVNARLNDNFIKDNNQQQLQMLALFNRIMTEASALNDFVGITKFTSAKAISSKLGDIYTMIDNVGRKGVDIQERFKVISSPFIAVNTNEDVASQFVHNDPNFKYVDMENPEEYLEHLIGDPFAFEQCMYDLVKTFIHDLCKKEMLPYESGLYTDLRENLHSLDIFGNLNGESIDQLHKDIPLWHLSSNTADYFNPNSTIQFNKNGNSYQIPVRDYYLYHFPELFDKFISLTNLSGRLYIDSKRLSTPYTDITDGNAQKRTIKELKIRTEYKFRNSSVRDEIADLFKKLPEEVQRDLLLYQYYKYGNNYSANGFSEMIPTDLRAQLQIMTSGGEVQSYRDIIYELVKEDAPKLQVTSNILQQFVLNHLNNEHFVREIKGITNYRNLQRALPAGVMLAGSNELQFIVAPTAGNTELGRIYEGLRYSLGIKFKEIGEDLYQLTYPPVIKINDLYFYADNSVVDLGKSKALFNQSIINLQNEKTTTVTYKQISSGKSTAGIVGYRSNWAKEKETGVNGIQATSFDYSGNFAVENSGHMDVIPIKDFAVTTDQKILESFSKALHSALEKDVEGGQSTYSVEDIMDIFQNKTTEQLINLYTKVNNHLNMEDRLVLNDEGEITKICKY